MGLTTGDGLAIMSICATLIVGLMRFAPSKKGNGNASGNIGAPFVATSFCDERHRGVDAAFRAINETLRELKEDVKELLGRTT